MSVILSAVVASALYHGPPPTPDQLVERLHAPRRGLTHYEVVIEGRAARGDARPYVRRVWRDGDRYRADHLDRFGPDGSARRLVGCTNAPEFGLFFAAHLDPVFDPAKAATMRPLADRVVLVDDRFRFDDLGATPEDFLNQTARGVRYYLDFAGDRRRVERVAWRGRAAYRLEAEGRVRGGRLTFELTVLPGRGYADVGARTVWVGGGREITQAAESEVARVGGVWLPVSSVATEHADGRLVSESSQRAAYPRMGRAPDPGAFSLAGIALPPGLLVGTADGLKRWDGQQLVPAR